MMYSFYPRQTSYRRIPRLPLRPPDNYLRDNMVRRWPRQDVEFDLMLQVQTDPFRMPIENAAVRWPEKLSPFVPAATRAHSAAGVRLAGAARLRRQPFLQPLALRARAPPARQPEPRATPDVLGAFRLRQEMNRTPHIEPTGEEVFAAE